MPSPAKTDRSAARAIALLAFAGFASQSMVRVADSLLPQIAGDFGVTVGAAAVVVWAYALAHGTVQLVIGPIGDRFGKFKCVTAAAAAAAILVLLCALAPTLPVLVVARIASGFAAGWIIPLAMAFVGDVIPYERRQRVLGRFLSGQITGQLFGQAVGGALADLFGWRNVFFLLAALFACASLALLIELRRNPVTRVGHELAGKSRGFIADNMTVLRSPWARTIIALVFVEAAAMFGAYAFVGAYLHQRFGLSLSIIGVLVGAFAVGGLLYSLSVGALVKRMAQKRFAASGGAVLLLGFTTLALTPVWQTVLISTVVIGFGFYLLHNTLQTNATQMAPQARGAAIGIFSSGLYFGQMVGVAISATVFDQHGGTPIFIGAGIVLLLLGLFFARALKRRETAAR